MRKPFIAALVLIALAGCSSNEEKEPAPAPARWETDLRQFCEAKREGWLMSTIARIDRALPESFEPGSIAFEGLNIQAPFDGRQNASEVQLRLTAGRAGQTVQLSAYATLARGSCAMEGLEIIEGFNRFDPPLRVAVPD